MPKKPSKKKKSKSSDGDRAFSWYPGHMVKAKRELEHNLKLADAVLLMLDARAPLSTRHQELEDLLNSRSAPFALILNKKDLAERERTRDWQAHFKAQGLSVIDMSAAHGRGPGPLTNLLKSLESKINAKRARKGLLPREPRLMVAGLPNSGKSTLLNRLVGKTRFKAGKKPGLTRGAQWVKVAKRYQLLDTPGILYPRIEGRRSLSVLAAVGSVRRDILPHSEVTNCLLRVLSERARLAEFLGQELSQKLELEQAPELTLSKLSGHWGFQSKGDTEPERRAFERLLNMLCDPDKPVTWESPPEDDAL